MRAKEVRELWNLCFDDSEEFKDIYFSHIYKDNQSFYKFEDNKIVATFQAIPYSIFWNKDIMVPINYISGACTHPNYQNKGFMKSLLRDSMQEMYNKGICISTLIPGNEGLFNYYKKVGFTNQIKYKKTTKYFSKEVEENYLITKGEYTHSHYQLYVNGLRNGMLIHKEEDFDVIYKDYTLGKGDLYTIYTKHKSEIIGYCFAVMKNNELTIEGITIQGNDTNVKNQLVNNIIKEYNTPKAIIIEQSNINSDQNIDLGMARIINLKETISKIDEKDLIRIFNLNKSNNKVNFNDETLLENNFSIAWNRNKIAITKEKYKNVKTLDIKETTNKILGTKNMYLELMMN